MKTFMIMLVLTLPFLGMAQTNSTIEDNFTSAHVSDTVLRAFEQRAVQKLKDLGDYLVIIANPSLDDKLRKAAMVQAEALFASVGCGTGMPVGNLSLPDFLTKVYKGEIAPAEIQHVTVENRLALHQGNYAGTVNNSFSHNNTMQQQAYGIVLSRIRKQFGNEVKEVWEVKLCPY